MKHLKHILILQFVFVALSFFVERPVPRRVSLPAVPVSEFSKESMRPVAFTQPETVHHVVSNGKTFSFGTGFLADFFVLRPPQTLALQACATVLTQDINQCKSVSVLIFPHHLFW